MSFRLSSLITHVFYRSGDIDDSPVESSPIYQKFRSISYRLRELLNMLTVGMVMMMVMMMMVMVMMVMVMMMMMMMMMTLITIFSR